MSLSYFYGLTDLSTGIISDEWTYNAVGANGDFLGNSASNAVVRTVSGNNFEDFSLYFTYKKLQSSFNSGAVSLFSNYSGGGGFTFGLDANNFPFLKTPADCFTFDSLELGGKNCLCLQKAGNAFSLSRYDIPSSGVKESQSFFIAPSTQLSGGIYKFGGTVDTISGLNNFYGQVDQLFFLSEKVSAGVSATIFSGFSALSASNNPFGLYVMASDEWYIPNTGSFGTGIQAALRDYFTGVYQDYVVDENLDADTEYLSRISFVSGVSEYEARNYYDISTFGFCQTGLGFQMGDPDVFPFTPGMPTGSFSVNGQFTIGPVIPEISAFLASEMYFTYDLSAIQPGLRYSNLVVLQTFDDIVEGSNTGYFTGFEMKGVFAPDSIATLLGDFPANFGQVGNEAIFDSVSGVFRAQNVLTGLPVYLNGLQETGFSFNSGIVDIFNYTETSSDDVIYDQVSGLSLVSFSLASAATGDFYAGTSFVATGNFSFDTLYRIRTSEYYETHPYHLFHGKNWQETAAGEIFNNVDENWT